jgi:Uma2 family endonuclease
MATVTLPEIPVAELISHDRPLEASYVEAPLYEVVNGKKVELPPMATSSSRVASILGRKLGNHAEDQGLGRVLMETLHWIDETGNLKRRPDVSFVSYERWPKSRPITDEEAWDVVPELAVEVVSPSDKADDLLEKIEEYFASGVLQVWVIYPRRRVAHVSRSFTEISVVKEAGELEGGSVLSGFHLSLERLFEELAPRPPRGTGSLAPSRSAETVDRPAPEAPAHES